ncbi:hypothetical protein FVE85_9633 [Porphyridium purpureum]|uniref:Uncharacterized protein n=1 Tax=Porphyridium purpureum TaxID=35688 RepID=A0A5J4YK67_PORPP|nr:hypothetical protein FVE85_7823 [Porphyridium purpureum]KAA8491586.1 hypothetical protein FVE85_9633 [Porphyridium purpureum]|eukprot:POR7824..scf210_14
MRWFCGSIARSLNHADDFSSDEPKHVFVSPLWPYLGAFLSLALYLMEYTASGESHLLDGGTLNWQMPSKMRSGICHPDIESLLESFGWTQKAMGLFHFEKGRQAIASRGEQAPKTYFRLFCEEEGLSEEQRSAAYITSQWEISL